LGFNEYQRGIGMLNAFYAANFERPNAPSNTSLLNQFRSALALLFLMSFINLGVTSSSAVHDWDLFYIDWAI
jgi:hypothetical protein